MAASGAVVLRFSVQRSRRRPLAAGVQALPKFPPNNHSNNNNNNMRNNNNSKNKSNSSRLASKQYTPTPFTSSHQNLIVISFLIPDR